MQSKEPKTALILVTGSQNVFQDKSKEFRGMNLQMSHCFRLFIWYVCRAISSVENISSLFNDSSRNKEFIFTFKQ